MRPVVSMVVQALRPLALAMLLTACGDETRVDGPPCDPGKRGELLDEDDPCEDCLRAGAARACSDLETSWSTACFDQCTAERCGGGADAICFAGMDDRDETCVAQYDEACVAEHRAREACIRAVYGECGAL